LLREKIYTLANKMCRLFKDTDFQPVCENILDFGIDKVIDYMQQKLSPEYVCGLVKLCPSQLLKVEHPIYAKIETEEPREGPLLCKGCITLVNAVETMLQANFTVNKVKELARQMCNVFNGTVFYKICINTVDTSIDKIIQLVIEKFPPETVCTKIGLCEAVQALVEEGKVSDSALILAELNEITRMQQKMMRHMQHRRMHRRMHRKMSSLPAPVPMDRPMPFHSISVVDSVIKSLNDMTITVVEEPTVVFDTLVEEVAPIPDVEPLRVKPKHGFFQKIMKLFA
jgi:hypothetical protein